MTLIPASVPRWTAFCLTTIACTACANYSFDVTRPPDNNPIHAVADHDTNLNLDPLRYDFRADEGHLVLRIGNASNDPIQLLGHKSSVVDPDGLSHPLHSETILPDSSIKEIFPPLRPVDQETGPSQSAQPPGPFGANDQPGYIPPANLGDSSSDADWQNSPYYWQWDGQSEIRLHLLYQWGKQTFEQDFVISRVRQ